jgi:hypothetical protein
MAGWPLRNIGPALLALLVPLSAAGEGLPAGPQSSAQEIRMLRGALRMPARKIVFNLSEDGGVPQESVAVTLAGDLVEVSRRSTDRLYDFALRRMFSIDRTGRSFTNTALYAPLAFRVFEAQNRAALARMLDAAKLGTKAQSSSDPFWAASELGVPIPNQAPTIEQRAQPDGSLAFWYGGQEVARFTPSAVALSPDELKRLGSFLRYECALHPQIVAALLASGRLPRKLAFERRVGAKRTRVTYDLVSAEALDVSYPLPDDYRADLLPAKGGDAGIEEFRSLLPLMLEAAALRHGGGPRSVSDFEIAIDRALSTGNGFQAMLLALELQLQHGSSAADCATAPVPQPCHSLREIGAAVRGDERARSFLAATRVEQVEHDPGKAIELRRAIPRDDLASAYVIDDQIANAMTMKGLLGSETLSLFANAIRGNPYVPTFYKDLGDYFARQYRTDLAWLCYDLGRALPGANATPVLPSITDLEKRFVADFPQFF